jgi:PKD repeat protein
VWTLIVTKPTTVSQQVQVLSTTFVLPSATLPVIRGNFRYVGSAGSCTTGSYDDRDDLVFALSTGPVNQPPSVNAGSNQTITLPAAANLNGTVSDDGLPNPPGTVTVTWTMDSGPGTVTFTNPAAAVTTATFSVAGTYVLRLTANDGALSASATVTITAALVPPVNQPPVVNAGSNQTITLPATANLNGTVTDDGLPNPPAAVTVAWSKDSGPGTVTFANPAAKTTTATFSVAGSYVLRLTASDSALSASATVTITVNPAPPVNQPPVVNAGSNQTITLPASANLNGTATDDGLPNPPATVTVTWSKDSGPGTVTFANPAAKTTTATFSVAGSYVLRLTANDSALSASATVTITVNAAPVNQPPVVNAGSNQTITLPAAANLNGTVTDDGLPNPPGTITVTWSTVSGPGTVTFANPAAKVTTATFSAAGTYSLKLTASDSVLTASATTTVTVNAAGTGACAGLCTPSTIFTVNGSYQSGNLGAGAVCYQTTSVVHGGNCSNFTSPRTLKVNGTTESCDNGNWSSIPAARNGGYCIQTTSGNQPWAAFAVW